ncbi:hypothetical protein M569_16477, partial [Genlisea aurea]
GAEIFLSLLSGGFLLILLWFFDNLILNPRKLRSRLVKQGIRGPDPAVFLGNIPEIKRISQTSEKKKSKEITHAWFADVFPHLDKWRKTFGPTFLYSTGNIQFLCITDPEMVKEISLHTSLNIGKPSYLSTDRGPLLGNGIFSSNGAYWSHQRKIIAPEFYLDKVKRMVKLMADSTLDMMKTWEKKAENRNGCRVDEDLRSLSGDIISRACFGRSYAQGEQIFHKIQALQNLMSGCSIGVPGLRHIPNKRNLEIRKLAREVDKMVLEVIRSRSNEDDDDKNLLRTILLAAAENYEDENGRPATIDKNRFVVDNCKNMYLAGHETVAISSSWCLMILAAYPDWQARVRDEVLEVCGSEVPTADMLRKMKLLTMVIQETLRLYPPVAYVVREALRDVSVGGITIPRGINIQIPIPSIHEHEGLWGPDSRSFRPERFAGGISSACRMPYGFMPFGVGSRTCLGQNFAVAELKVVVSIVLSRFRLSLGSDYEHSPPEFRLMIQPKDGVRLVLEKL